MNTRIWISAIGLALAPSLMAQTDSQKEVQDEVKVKVEAALQAVEAYQGAYQLVTVNVEALPSAWVVPMVSGHPYSAAAREVTYSPDGQHIDRSETEMVYRDDQGRTRREMEGGKRVAILDPAAGIAYNLDSEQKTATKRTLAPAAIANQSRVPTQSPLEIATAQAKRRPNMTAEDLGTQVVNGVSAEGVRVTTVIPAGTVGNDRDLKTVVDRWVSSDLHILVKSVTTDSRAGATHYDLTNLVQGPPDPSLFQVPAGYTIEEGPGRGGRGVSVPMQFQPSTKK